MTDLKTCPDGGVCHHCCGGDSYCARRDSLGCLPLGTSTSWPHLRRIEQPGYSETALRYSAAAFAEGAQVEQPVPVAGDAEEGAGIVTPSMTTSYDEAKALREALTELVAVQDWKADLRYTELLGSVPDWKAWNDRNAMAWKAARAALAGDSKP
jgi:hypothetical protein